MAVTPNIGLNLPANGSINWDVPTNANWTTIDNIFGGTQTVPALSTTGNAVIGGRISSYGGVTTVGSGVPVVVAKLDFTTQSADIPLTTLYNVPSNGAGLYRLSLFTEVTRVASTSSTCPNGQFQFTGNDSGAVGNPAFGSTSTANALAAMGGGTVLINAKASTPIQAGTVNYASSGATSMQFAAHFKLEYLGA